MKVVGIPEWIIDFAKSLYPNLKIEVILDGEISEEVVVNVSAHPAQF